MPISSTFQGKFTEKYFKFSLPKLFQLLNGRFVNLLPLDEGYNSRYWSTEII